MTVEEIGDRGQPNRADVAQVNLDSVLFAVANVPIEPSPELRTPKQPTAGDRLGAPVPDHRDDPPGGRASATLREALNELSGRFIPVTDATYWSDRLGEARQSALIVAVNHKRAQILAQHQEVDPWAGLGAPGAGRRPDAEPRRDRPLLVDRAGPSAPPHSAQPPSYTATSSLPSSDRTQASLAAATPDWS